MCSRTFVVNLAGHNFELRRDISEPEDYVHVHETVWELLKSWYGGGPELKRSVIGVGIQVRTSLRRCASCSYLLQTHGPNLPVFACLQEARLDLYPIILRFFRLGTDGHPVADSLVTLPFSRMSNLKEVFNYWSKRLEDQQDGEDDWLRLWMHAPAKAIAVPTIEGDGTEKAGEKWQPVKAALMEQQLELFRFRFGATLWVETKDNKHWVRSAIKQVDRCVLFFFSSSVS